MVKLKKISYILLSVCIGATLLGGCGSKGEEGKVSGTKSEAKPLEKEGYTVDWHDEFDGSELNTKTWLAQSMPHTTTSPDGCRANYVIEDGALKLIIDEDSVDFNTGNDGGLRVSGIQTYEKNGLHVDETTTTVAPFDGYKTQYGYFEMRAKMPSCDGGGAAVWSLIGTEPDAQEDGTGSAQDGEINILKTLFSATGTTSPTVRPLDDPDLTAWEQAVELPKGDYAEEWHTYAVDWTPEGLTFYVDDKEIARTEQSPQYEMCMFLNLYASDDASHWSGGAANDTFPKEWAIDYIRVYKIAGGYPNGVTKPTEPEASKAIEIVTDGYSDTNDPAATLGYTDVARNANLTTTAEPIKGTAENDQLELIAPDFNLAKGWCSADKPEFPGEFEFTWDTPQDVNAMNLFSRFSAGQAPTEIEIQVQKPGGEWTSVAEYKITWLASTEIVEYAKMDIPDADGITGLKLIIKDANLQWKHYAFTRVHIYKAQ